MKTNVIQFPVKNKQNEMKENSNKSNLFVNPDTGKLEGRKSPHMEDVQARMDRIKSSLERINSLIGELNKIEKDKS